MKPAEGDDPAREGSTRSAGLVDERGRPIVILSGPPRGRTRTALHGFGALLLFWGLIQLVPGLWDLGSMLRVATAGLRTTGEVIALHEMTDLKGIRNVYPVVRFTTASGTSVQFQERLASSFPVGSRVPVMYRPEAPADTATIRRPVMNWVHGAVFSFAGLLLSVLGLRLLLV